MPKLGWQSARAKILLVASSGYYGLAGWWEFEVDMLGKESSTTWPSQQHCPCRKPSRQCGHAGCNEPAGLQHAFGYRHSILMSHTPPPKNPSTTESSKSLCHSRAEPDLGPGRQCLSSCGFLWHIPGFLLKAVCPMSAKHITDNISMGAVARLLVGLS